VRSYFVPVSRFMPLFSLDVELDVPNDWIVKLCNHELEELCFGSPQTADENAASEVEPSVKNSALNPAKGEGSIWKLPIGQHARSAYKFRVSQSTTACTEEPSGAGSIYFEYNLFFYRVCTA